MLARQHLQRFVVWRLYACFRAEIEHQHYHDIMPLLLNVLENANGPDYGKLRLKAMECAGLIGMFPSLTFACPYQLRIAIAVGADVFRADAPALVEALMRIQSTPRCPTLVGHSLTFRVLVRLSARSWRRFTTFLSHCYLGEGLPSAWGRVRAVASCCHAASTARRQCESGSQRTRYV